MTIGKVYISRNYKGLSSAGSKAKADVEAIIQDVGFRNVGLESTYYSNPLIHFIRNLIGVFKAICYMPWGNGILLLQYPMKKYFTFICYIAHLRNLKIIALIHDLGAFRSQRLTVAQEIARLNCVDYVIAQNQEMSNWLETYGYKGKLGVLEVFDYLSSGQNNTKCLNNVGSKKRYVVNYIGALNRIKNAFLYEMPPYVKTYDFHVYGGGFSLKEGCIKNPNFVYNGFCASDNLIAFLLGDFGLVWDGDSLDTCSGNLGVYLKYNSPHKTSLYIRCHLPVIIWREAAMAPFIERENIGVVIDSLTELDQLLTKITAEQYNEMKKKCNKNKW